MNEAALLAVAETPFPWAPLAATIAFVALVAWAIAARRRRGR
jgi:hypothetical protein